MNERLGEQFSGVQYENVEDYFKRARYENVEDYFKRARSVSTPTSYSGAMLDNKDLRRNVFIKTSRKTPCFSNGDIRL